MNKNVVILGNTVEAFKGKGIFCLKLPNVSANKLYDKLYDKANGIK